MDTLGDILSIIKNASMVRKPYVEVDHSSLVESVAEILKMSGFVSGVKVFKLKDSVRKKLRVDLNTDSNVIVQASRVSKPGRRIYRSHDELKPVRNGYGIGIVSTSAGLMSTVEAKKRHLGGEVLCEIY